MNNIAIIPARGGSKRIPEKNIIDFYGKPMIIWTLEAAKKAAVFSKIVVSTESRKIADIVEKFGFEVMMRPDELATDKIGLAPVVINVFEQCQKQQITFDNACLLMANCPIRDYEDIKGAWNTFINSGSDFLMSVFKYGMFYPFWALENTPEGLKPYWGEKYFQQRSQELPEVFCPSGAIRWFNINTFVKIQKFYGPNLQPYVIPWYKAIDIDEYEDLKMAQMIYSFMINNPE